MVGTPQSSPGQAKLNGVFWLVEKKHMCQSKSLTIKSRQPKCRWDQEKGKQGTVTREAPKVTRPSGKALPLQLGVRSFYRKALYLRWVLAHKPFHDSNIPISKPSPHPEHGVTQACVACLAYNRCSTNSCDKQLWAFSLVRFC